MLALNSIFITIEGNIATWLCYRQTEANFKVSNSKVKFLTYILMKLKFT